VFQSCKADVSFDEGFVLENEGVPASGRPWSAWGMKRVCGSVSMSERSSFLVHEVLLGSVCTVDRNGVLVDEVPFHGSFPMT